MSKSTIDSLPSTVITVMNDSQDRKQCKKINNLYYLINRDCFKINDKWYRKELTEIDNYSNTRVLVKPSKLQKVLISKNTVGYSSNYYNLYIFDSLWDYFDGLSNIPNVEDYIRYDSYGRYIKCCSKFIPGELEPVYSNEGFYCFKHEKHLYTRINNANRSSKVYNFSKVNKEIINRISTNINDENFLVSTGPISKYFKDYTYGFEIETSNGEIGNSCEDFGFVKLYDGSINGNEYASIPFNNNNFLNLRNFLEILKETHTVDYTCSTHIHIGGIPFSEENALCLYLVFYRLQNELHELCAPYKKSTNYLASKKDYKDHCKFLPRLISNDFDTLYNTIFSKKIPKEYYNTNKSASILEDSSKWSIDSRYFYVNFTNYILQKGGTIELRLLEGTFNYDKILNWLAINLAVINWTLANKSKVLENKEKIVLIDILREYFKEDYNIIKGYVDYKVTDYLNYVMYNELRLDRSYFSNSVDVTPNEFKFFNFKI